MAGNQPWLWRATRRGPAYGRVMQRVRDFYRELSRGQLLLAFQPVVWLPGSSRVLYQEGLLRRADAQGPESYPFALMEQHQMMRDLDRSVVQCVIDRLLETVRGVGYRIRK